MMNTKWQNEKYLTCHNARRYGGEGVPSGMRPAGNKEVAFLRNARNRVGYNCYRAIFPTGIGNKSQRVGSAINTGSLTQSKTTEYIGNMIYENGALKRILIDGGYIDGGIYIYYITDHQGNNRTVVSSANMIVQSNHYYPFGNDANEKRARQLEKQLDKQITKLEKEVAKITKNGGDVGDRNDRIAELKGSQSDISDMRSNESTEFRYAKASDKNNEAGRGNSATSPTGTNDAGDNVVTMFSDKGTQIHETRHGGQVARGEYGFQGKEPTAGYGLDSEVSAYRAQYAYDGKFNYKQADFLRNAPDAVANIFLSIGSSIIPIVGVNNINLINRSLIQNIGVEGSFNGSRTWLPLYQRLK